MRCLKAPWSARASTLAGSAAESKRFREYRCSVRRAVQHAVLRGDSSGPGVCVACLVKTGLALSSRCVSWRKSADARLGGITCSRAAPSAMRWRLRRARRPLCVLLCARDSEAGQAAAKRLLNIVCRGKPMIASQVPPRGPAHQLLAPVGAGHSLAACRMDGKCED